MSTSQRARQEGGASPFLSQSHVMRAERIKLFSLRSTWALIACGVAAALLTAVLSAAGAVIQDRANGHVPKGFDALSSPLSGTGTFIYLLAMIAVIQVTSELSSGMARTTFAAVPRRRLVILGKATSFGALAVPVTAGGVLLSYGAGQALLSTRDLNAELGLSAVQVVTGAAGYALAVGIFGQVLAWLIKSTVGAAFALLGVTGLVGPVVDLLLPERISNDVVPFLPAEAAAALMGTDPSGGALNGLVAAPVTVLWCALGLLIAARSVSRRDI